MKQTLLRMLAVVVVMMMGLSLVSCKNTDSSESNASTTAPAENTTEESVTNEKGKFSSVEEFVKSDIMQQTMEELKEIMEDQNMSIELKGEGDKLIYEFTISGVAADQMEALKSSLESGLEAQAATYEGIAEDIKDEVEVENPSVGRPVSGQRGK